MSGQFIQCLDTRKKAVENQGIDLHLRASFELLMCAMIPYLPAYALCQGVKKWEIGEH